jgi:hypothetical protein
MAVMIPYGRMTHLLEQAPTSRSQCRSCGRKIERGELRFGERRSNAFGEGETTLWFHPLCAAYSRPEPLLEFMSSEPGAALAELRPLAELGVAHPHLARLTSAQRSPTGRANCRHCHRAIEKETWRLALVFFEEFRFSASGFIHAACAGEYLGTTELIARVRHFSPDLGEDDIEDLKRAITTPAPGAPA